MRVFTLNPKPLPAHVIWYIDMQFCNLYMHTCNTLLGTKAFLCCTVYCGSGRKGGRERERERERGELNTVSLCQVLPACQDRSLGIWLPYTVVIRGCVCACVHYNNYVFRWNRRELVFCKVIRTHVVPHTCDTYPFIKELLIAVCTVCVSRIYKQWQNIAAL